MRTSSRNRPRKSAPGMARPLPGLHPGRPRVHCPRRRGKCQGEFAGSRTDARPLLRRILAVSSTVSSRRNLCHSSRTMNPLRWLLCCSLAALLAGLTACSSKKDSGKVKVAFISNNAYEFWKLAERGTQDAAQELGEVEVEFKMPHTG